tara:strand:- start:868 stop:1005 length:138 start_codon:yes stop_codon:yes gene_type:complete
VRADLQTIACGISLWQMLIDVMLLAPRLPGLVIAIALIAFLIDQL